MRLSRKIGKIEKAGHFDRSLYKPDGDASIAVQKENDNHKGRI